MAYFMRSCPCIRDVPTSPFEANGQVVVPSAGIASSQPAFFPVPEHGTLKMPEAVCRRLGECLSSSRGSAMNACSRTFTTTLLLGVFATAAAAQELGRVHFETSCTPQAQQKFDRGLAMVHSFVYPDSVAAFTEAAAADPECAIAYWGIAISHRPNPLIMPLTAAVLKNGLEAVEKGKAIGTKTERERDWLAAIELYYKDYDKVDQTTRGLAYEKAMERLMQKYPDDPEAAIFYALALNETALPSDKTYANQLKAGAILEKVAASQPDHPGALHYLIHSYDYPPLAHRALDCCQQIRPDCPGCASCQTHARAYLFHARAMGAVGRVEYEIARNAPRSKQPDSGRGRFTQPSHTTWILWSTPSCKWGRSSARNRSATTAMPSRSSGSKVWVSYTGLAAVPARFALERQAWNEAAALEPRGSQFPQAEAITYFARAIGLRAQRRSRGRRSGASTSSRNCAPRWKRRTSPIGPSKSKSRCWLRRPGLPMPRGRRRRRSSSCAPQQTWRITAKSTSPWRTGSTRCANCWATFCWNSDSLHRR